MDGFPAFLVGLLGGFFLSLWVMGDYSRVPAARFKAAEVTCAAANSDVADVYNHGPFTCTNGARFEPEAP